MTLSNKEVCLIYSLMFLLSLVIAAKAQEHNHGINVPDWYDPDCCNLQDCRPVLDKDVDFSTDELNQPVVRYKELIYNKSRWRRSKDERYHACFRGETVYCIYIPTGV